MNRANIFLPRVSRPGNRLTVIFLIVGVFSAYLAADYILNARLMELGLIAIGCAMCVLVVTILNDWRKGLMIFLGWLLFEDLLRKYLGNNMAIYFAKDALAAVFYVSFFTSMRRARIRLFQPPFRVLLLLMIWFGALQVFNPASPSIFYGLMGLKLFFYYVPLILVGYSLLNSEKDLRRFVYLNLIFLLIIGSLGVAQSIIGHTFLNPTILQEDIHDLATLYRASPITGLVSYRPNSVFVSTGRYVNFLIVGWQLALGFTGYLLFRRREGRIFTFVVVIVTAAALVLSASRGAFMWEVIDLLAFSIAFVWGTPWRTKEVIRVLRTIQRATLGLVMALVLLFLLFPEALQSRLSLYYETLSPTSPNSELVHRARDYPIANFLTAFNDDRWLYGYGIGTSGLGTQYVTRLFHTSQVPIAVESGFGSLIIEFGIVGLILWLTMAVAIVVSAWRVVSQLRGSAGFPIAFVIFWFAFILLFPLTFGGIVLYEDFVLNAYFWLLLGILFRLPHLAFSEQFTIVDQKTG
jgi:hypothetical protein